jgi:hypothetical protein
MGLRRLSAAELRGIKPFVSSLAQSCPCKHGRDFAPFVNKAVRKNLTIPAWLNTFAEARHINFSQVLQDSLAALYQRETAAS